MNLVIEWTAMSAPQSNGRRSQGEASVLSTTSGTPHSAAMAAIGSISITTPPGLASDSQKTNFTLSVIAARTLSTSVMSTKRQVQPSLAKVMPNWVSEPP